MSSGQTRSRWWTVALSEDVPAGVPYAVSCDGDRYVLFRDASGAVRALHDECVHRRAPLSLGRVTAEGEIACPYHGWRYDGATGACTTIPNLSASERVPRAYRTPAFAVAEKDGFIHLWPEGSKGDERLIGDLSLGSLGSNWSGAVLVTYPREAFADLLLDAPGAVLEITGVTVDDGHPYGDPVVERDQVVVRYAASWATRGPRRVVADYPLAVRVAVAVDGRTARADLVTDDGQSLAAARLAPIPVGPTVTGVRWRGTGGQRANRAIEIGARAQIRPEAILAVYPYASAVRRDLDRDKLALSA